MRRLPQIEPNSQIPKFAFVEFYHVLMAGAIHVWQPLPAHWAAQSLAAAASTEGLVVAPSSAFCQTGDVPNAIRISLGGCTRRTELTSALRKLAALVERKPSADDRLLI